jgi:hypothetical protein
MHESTYCSSSSVFSAFTAFSFLTRFEGVSTSSSSSSSPSINALTTLLVFFLPPEAFLAVPGAARLRGVFGAEADDSPLSLFAGAAPSLRRSFCRCCLLMGAMSARC